MWWVCAPPREPGQGHASLRDPGTPRGAGGARSPPRPWCLPLDASARAAQVRRAHFSGAPKPPLVPRSPSVPRLRVLWGSRIRIPGTPPAALLALRG
jgi:hypothetical protein